MAEREVGGLGFVGSMLRPDDQVRLTFELVNGTVDVATNEIQPLLGEESIWYVVSFGSQHTDEDTISAGDVPPDAAVGHRRAGASRVSFEIPAGTPYTIANLLSLSSYALHVDPRADGADGDPHDEPDADTTSLEIPFSLIVSPTAIGPTAGHFESASTPIESDGVTELWRAHLRGPRDGTDLGAAATVRAIARRGDIGGPSDDLDDLVAQTTGLDGIPMTADVLRFSSQGATVDIQGEWAGILSSYHHRAVNGRDLRVEIVNRGYLAPFGHRASLTTLTERSLRNDESGDLTASLASDTYLAITGPSISYSNDAADPTYDFMPYEGRNLPFTSVTALDTGRGPIGSDRIVLPNGSNIDRDKAALLTRDGDDLVVSYTATDRGGNNVHFELPVVFVADTEAHATTDEMDGKRTVLAKLATWYAEVATDERRELQLAGQPVAWADPTPSGGAGSVHATNRIRVSFDRPQLDGTDSGDAEDRLTELGRPAFYPGVAAAWVVDSSSSVTLGGDAAESEVTVAQRWLDLGTGDGNVDLGYLDLAAPTSISPTTDALGMLAASLNVGTFGQRLGAGVKFPGVGDDGWTWNPLDALSGLPKLLGVLALEDLIDELNFAELDSNEGFPSMSVDLQIGDDGLPYGVCFTFTWTPKLHSFPKGAGDKTFVVADDFGNQDIDRPTDDFDGGTAVLLELVTCVPEASTAFESRLDRFAVQLPPGAPVVAVIFRTVRFENVDGVSNVDVDVADWSFVNSLSWLEPLRSFLADLLSDGVTDFADGINIDYSLPIPGFSLGVVGVKGLLVDLELDLPDDGVSSVGLAVGHRENPFRITIMGYGGTGSFGLEVDASRIVFIEGSMAITYELAVDVFIASASLSASLGTFVEYRSTAAHPNGEVTLGAWAQLRGSVSVLGLVELTGTVTVTLAYNITTKVLRGTAAVTGEVSCIFGKTSVTHDVTVKVALGRDDGGGRLAALPGLAISAQPVPPRPFPPDDAPTPSSDLSFRDHYTRPQWADYCAAFAAA